MGAHFSASTQDTISIDERIDRALEIRQLQAEIQALKAENNELRAEMTQLLKRKNNKLRGSVPGIIPVMGTTPAAANDRVASEVSILEVHNFVEKLLADPTTNLSMVPDFIERPAERTMLLFLLKAMAHTLDTSSIKFLGHEVIMRLQPIQSSDPTQPSHPAQQPRYERFTDEDYHSNDDAPTNTQINAHSIPL